MGPGADVVWEVYLGDGRVEEDDVISTSTQVNSMSLVYFQQQLGIHFATMFARNLIK